MGSVARRLVPAAAIAAAAVVPLVGLSLQGDERRSLYRAANLLASSPLEALGQASYGAGSPSASRSLGPLGRVAESLQHAFAFEIAEGMGLAPHVVQGAVRVALVVILAGVAVAAVSAVLRSSGLGTAASAAALFPLVLGASLVAGGTAAGVAGPPFVSVGGPVLVLALALFVARDADMGARTLRWPEAAAVALTAAAAALTHGLVVVAPAAVGGLVVARAVAAGQTSRALRQTAAVRRWVALTAGVAVAVVSERIVAAGPCDGLVCFDGSSLSLSGGRAAAVPQRLLIGAPPAAWAHVADLAEQAGLRFGVIDLVANSLLALLVAVIVFVGFRQWRQACSGWGDVAGVSAGMRSAAGLAVLGAAVAVPPAVLTALADRWRSAGLSIGEASADTLLVQVGWAFVAAAGVAAALAAATRLRPVPARQATVAAVAGLLAVAAVMTLLANERLAYVDRRDPQAAVVSEISEFTVVAEPGSPANALRCGLISQYQENVPGPDDWAAGPQLRAELDRLMLQRHSWPFCTPQES